MTAIAEICADKARIDAAKFAHAYAREHCHTYAENQTCAWYHGSWQFLRLLDLVSTPVAHAFHYDRQLDEISQDSRFKNILVSGSADAGLVKTIREAYLHRNAEINLSVVDICPTPLKICREYAASAGIPITTLEQDILNGLPADSFDAIFTHSFMGYFDDDNRQLLIRQWSNSLRKGGRLITVQRIRENYAGDFVRFSDHEIENFVARTTELLRDTSTADLEPFDIVSMARQFAENFRNYPVRSADQLRSMLENAGFKLNLFEQQTTLGTAGVTGPSVPNSAGFYLIVAERK